MASETGFKAETDGPRETISVGQGTNETGPQKDVPVSGNQNSSVESDIDIDVDADATATDNTTKTTPVTSTTQHLPLPTTATAAATDQEKRDLIGHYADLFFHHFRQYRDPLERMDVVNHEIWGRAKLDRRYLSICALHAEYFLMMSQYLRHTPDVLESACRELSKFLDVQEYWWPLCVNLPSSSQATRLALVDAVFERVRDPNFDVTAFQAEYAASHSEDFDEGVVDILHAWLDVAAAAAGGEARNIHGM
ncbi:hypothetical protein AYO21_02116 [Fonsecaea monophora]|uniref:Uncharacterized protein n=1 Tax=Fonsecaea monophora TaxID=254056 RepID=A0A177FIR1_9EURO|nr:hypothetical protein AYO21_02116 [Fonsecaea monophora]KAH0844129.1 hypothetical protein FOPE_09021 [Fonsecaea pedrosoi]OAG43530.1 hypothetical protein AYO21_02116 [Fonsecaea monophora]